MRYFFIFLVILFLIAVAYSYQQDSTDCLTVVNDVKTLVIHVASGGQPPNAAPPSKLIEQTAPATQPEAITNPSPATAVTVPSANPLKTWAPPSVLPAQPNWTWSTSDGKTYQNVVVTKIEPDTVSITHSMGVAHIPMDLLPPDIQKQLNYDPKVAAEARAEVQRETDHPYYTMASVADAQAEAQKLQWPLAWLSSLKADISSNPPQGDEAAMTGMALDYLKDKTVIIFINADSEMGQTPPIVHHQFSKYDDGQLPGGANYLIPKVVFSSPDASTILGRVSYTQMKASGATAISAAFASIPSDSSVPTASSVPAATNAEASPFGVPAPPASSAPVASATPAANKPLAPPDVMPSQPNWTWNTVDGKTYQNVVVTKIEPDTVSITHSMGAAHIQISMLPPDIQKQLNYNPHAASQFTTLIEDKLVSADGTAASTPDASVQYFAVYYSAQWCPPCHAFSPRLVKWYNAFKPSHPNFELIFVSEDHNEAAMFDYMKEMSMPWPAVRFSELNHDGHGTFRGSGIEKFAGDGIPDLVLVDSSGKVLSDSYQNGTYVGPETVVNDINKLIGGTSPVPLAGQNPVTPSSSAGLVSAR